MTDSPHDATTVTQWLNIHRERFYTELEERLDIEAGLEEVLLAEHHHELVDTIQKNLDVEAGLAAILPAPPITVPQEQPFVAGSLEWATEALARMPLQQRLTLRAHYASRLGFAAREVGTLETGAITAAGFDEMATQVKGILAARLYERRGFGHAEVQVIDVRNRLVHGAGVSVEELTALAKELQHSQIPYLRAACETLLSVAHEDLFPKNEVTAADAFGMSVTKLFSAMAEKVRDEDAKYDAEERRFAVEAGAAEEWRFAVADYVGVMLASVRHRIERAPQLSSVPDLERAVADHLRELVGHLAFLEQILNDFVGADLRHAELTGVSLDGLRWSDRTTRWPDSWREQIERDSVQINDDVYEVHYGTHTRGRNTLV